MIKLADTQENVQENIKAPVQTTTNTLDVTCVDTYGNEYTFKLDNFKPNLTLQNVQEAFAIGINSGYWYSRAGYQFVSVKRAATVQTVKVTTALE